MTTKIAISLPDELLDQARRAVAEGRAASVSAYIAESVMQRERRDSLTELLDDLDRELGPPGPEAQEWAGGVARALGWK
jgi:Arc/MetJ-type ribon-helix-helix transcriptional regulator